MFKGIDFRSESSSFLFKCHRVRFLFCERAVTVHQSSDLLDGSIVLEDAVDIEGDDFFVLVLDGCLDLCDTDG